MILRIYYFKGLYMHVFTMSMVSCNTAQGQWQEVFANLWKLYSYFQWYSTNVITSFNHVHLNLLFELYIIFGNKFDVIWIQPIHIRHFVWSNICYLDMLLLIALKISRDIRCGPNCMKVQFSIFLVLTSLYIVTLTLYLCVNFFIMMSPYFLNLKLLLVCLIWSLKVDWILVMHT
jgi:hypothetical protein